MKALPFILLLIFISVLFAGCICNLVVNKNIDVSIVDSSSAPIDLGMMNHHNISIMIRNNGDTTAKSLHVEAYYCLIPKNIPGNCVNNSFNIGDLPANSAYETYFLYDRDVVHEAAEATEGSYKLYYLAESCYS